ncbi:MAG: aldolase catalytic domain-containing protein [Eubacterium sp.]|nr:aldolase catalytic domain-containing protein [Eubacterium sp.]
MNEIKLLDCTLRDGGYVNDWNFGHNNLVSIFERLADAGTDIIEVGFIDERRIFDINRSIMPDTDCVEKIYGGLDRKQSMVVGMIDYGTCSIAQVKPCSVCFLDGIRVIFKKHLRKEAFSFCTQLKKLGYKVFAQLVSVTSYSDEEMADLVRLANEVKPYAVSMVDTYGLMHQDNLMHYFHLLNDKLEPEIGLGYHGHNNFQMGYANCIAMVTHKATRMMIVDGSIYGMGKSAGNAPTELIMMYLNQMRGKQYQISQVLEAIDVNLSQFCQPQAWGYNLFYYLAASNDCHPAYVADLMNKRTLSVRSVNELLGRLEGEKKLLYDKDYLEQQYILYQDQEANDEVDAGKLMDVFKGRSILLAGPGLSMQTEQEKIEKYVASQKPVVISINYIPDFLKSDYIFLSNAKRYVQLASKLSREKHSVIATSNMTCANGKFDYTLNISPLLDLDAQIIDNSLVMLLKAMIRLGVRKITLAGFDGYTGEGMNYFNPDMEYGFAKEMADYLNQYTARFLQEKQPEIQVEFLTASRYAGGMEHI